MVLNVSVAVCPRCEAQDIYQCSAGWFVCAECEWTGAEPDVLSPFDADVSDPFDAAVVVAGRRRLLLEVATVVVVTMSFAGVLAGLIWRR